MKSLVSEEMLFKEIVDDARRRTVGDHNKNTTKKHLHDDEWYFVTSLILTTCRLLKMTSA
jgi:hypothetical protein